eukprot:m.283582 g.283582  ORF g.283582 m.283582 type:complete len:178 (-) comp11119_c0_seq29:1200-1733(-)
MSWRECECGNRFNAARGFDCCFDCSQASGPPLSSVNCTGCSRLLTKSSADKGFTRCYQCSARMRAAAQRMCEICCVKTFDSSRFQCCFECSSRVVERRCPKCQALSQMKGFQKECTACWRAGKAAEEKVVRECPACHERRKMASWQKQCSRCYYATRAMAECTKFRKEQDALRGQAA